MPKRFQHQTLLFDSALSAPEKLPAGGRRVPYQFPWKTLWVGELCHLEHCSPILVADFPFNEVIFSWNVCPGQCFLTFELQVSRDGTQWTPWLYMGDAGLGKSPGAQIVKCDEGRVDVDIFRSDVCFTHYRFRLRAFGEHSACRAEILRFGVCLSDMTGVGVLLAETERGRAVAGRLEVPCHSQQLEDPVIAGRICSPTSVSMMLAYYGIDFPVSRVAEKSYDPKWKIYGNWARNVQAAFALGLAGCVLRLDSLTSASAYIEAGCPLVIRIKAKKGELRGAPYEESDGHLLVLCGFDRSGAVLVNDPAADSPSEVCRCYAAEEMETVWLQTGGTAYFLTNAF